MTTETTALPTVPRSQMDFPDITTADISEILERRGISRPESKLQRMLEKLDQAAIKKAAKKVGSDFSEQIEAAYAETARQLDKKDLI